MGRSNRQRRADKQRRAQRQLRIVRRNEGVAGDRTDESQLTERDIEQMVILAARIESLSEPHRPEHLQLMQALAQLETAPRVPAKPSDVIDGLLRRCVVSMYDHGWQPADIVHVVRKEWTVRAARLIVAVIAGEARASDAAGRAPAPWLSQLEDLGVYDPATGRIVGGNGSLAGWQRAERLDPDEMLAVSLRVLGHLLMAPRQPVLVEPPSRWGATNRGSARPQSASSGDIDAKVLKVIRSLLAKAEATTFEAEADAFTAKAQEMMTRYSIDAAVLASTAGGAAGRRHGVESKRVHLDSPYADEKAALLAVIAGVNGAKSIWSPSLGHSTVTGFPVDLHLTDLLFTSLLVQATRASADATSTKRYLRTASFRRAFLVSFATRIAERLRGAKQQAAATATQQYGSALVPILADREAAIDEETKRLFPKTAPMSRRRFDSEGWYAGRAAADRANIGTGAAIAGA